MTHCNHQTHGAMTDQTHVHNEYTVHVINSMAMNDIKHKPNQCLPESAILRSLFAVSMSPSLTALRTVSPASAPVENQEESHFAVN